MQRREYLKMRKKSIIMLMKFGNTELIRFPDLVPLCYPEMYFKRSSNIDLFSDIETILILWGIAGNLSSIKKLNDFDYQIEFNVKEEKMDYYTTCEASSSWVKLNAKTLTGAKAQATRLFSGHGAMAGDIKLVRSTSLEECSYNYTHGEAYIKDSRGWM